MILSSNELVARAKQAIKEIDVATLRSLDQQNPCLIDCREPMEFEAGHVDGAVNLPRGVLEMQIINHPSVAGTAQPLEALAERDVYIICRSGARSALAAESLQKMGFSKVYSVAGGMVAWQGAGYPVVA